MNSEKYNLNMDRFRHLIQLFFTGGAADIFIHMDYRVKVIAKKHRITRYFPLNFPNFFLTKKTENG